MPIRFQVDPDFYDHPKTTGMSDAAFSLWVRAGSFSAAKLTDGFISEDVLAQTLRSSVDVAGELTRRGLWRRVKGGYRFHEWEHRNLTKKRVETDRETDRARKRAARGGGTNSAGQNGNPQAKAQVVRPESERNPDGIQADSGGIPGVSVSVSLSESVSGSVSVLAAESGGPEGVGTEPSTRCPRHITDPDPPPCGGCAEARKAHGRWLAERNRRIEEAPRCRQHRGQLAHNCGPCRSERLGAAPEPVAPILRIVP